MKRKQALSLASLLIAGPSMVLVVALLLPHRINDEAVSGNYAGKQVWSGIIEVTGDTEIEGALTILAGTELKFSPESSLTVNGNLKALGTQEAPILFSAPKQVAFAGDKSNLDFVTLSGSRQGFLARGAQKKSIIQNSHFENGTESCVKSKDGHLQILSSSFVNCGLTALILQGTEIVRENSFQGGGVAISILGGTPSIENNLIKDSGSGIYIDPASEPKFLNNEVFLAE